MPRHAWIPLSALTLVLAACSIGGAAPRLVDQVEDAPLSNRAIRSWVDEYRRSFVVRVRDALLTSPSMHSDWVAREQVVFFALFVDRETSRAARHADGIIALIDIWALVAQLRAYFETGEGSVLLPDHRAVILELLTEADEKAQAGIDSLGDEEISDRAREVVARWVEEYPIRGRRMTRVSTAPMLLMIAGGDDESVFGSVASMEETLDRIDDSLANLIHELPTQLMLEAILLVDHYIQMLDPASLQQQVERTVALLESLPEWASEQRLQMLAEVDRMRSETLEQVSAEREAVVADLDRQRTATIAAVASLVQAERAAVVAAVADLVQGERVEVVAEIDRMRSDTIDRISAERVATVEQMELMRASTVEHAEKSLDRLVDHTAERVQEVVDDAFWKVALLLAVGLVAGLVAVVYVTRSFAPR